MSPAWRPDDSFLTLEAGKLKGVTRFKDALKKHGVGPGRRIVTSQDPGLDAVHRDLERTRLPKGFQQWQLPVALGPDENVLGFVTVGAPGSVLPAHSHNSDLFRVIVSGSLHYKDQVLSAGDWMLVRHDTTYEATVGSLGVCILHWYFPWWWPFDMVQGASPQKRKVARTSRARKARG